MFNLFKNLFKSNKATKDETIEALKNSVSQLQGMLEESYLAQDKAYVAGYEEGKPAGAMLVLAQLEKNRREEERDEKALKKFFNEM